MKVVRDNWAILQLKRAPLDAVRNQLSGHIQIKLEPVELTVENTDWKTPEFFVRKKTEIFEFAYRPQFVDVWTLLGEIAPLLSNSIAHLAKMLIGADIDFEKHQKDAAAFWQTQIDAA